MTMFIIFIVSLHLVVHRSPSLFTRYYFVYNFPLSFFSFGAPGLPPKPKAVSLEILDFLILVGNLPQRI